MASRYFNQFPGSLRFGLKYIEGSAQITTSGAVIANSFVGGGITASSTITLQKLATGYYALQLADPYYRIVGADIRCISPTSSAVSDGQGIVANVPYQILSGTSGTPSNMASTATNWYTLGLNKGLNPTPGQTFVATSGASNIPGSSTVAPGNGQVARVLTSGIAVCEVFPGENTMLAPTSAVSSVQGAIINFQTLNSSLAAASPNSGSTIRWNLWLDNSTRTLYNESTTAN